METPMETMAGGDPLIRRLAEAWGWVMLRGLAGIAFGVLAFLWPAMTVVVLVIMWGAWAFVDGIAALVTAWQARGQSLPVWPLVLIGLLGVAAGLVTLVAPGVAATALLALIGAWAIVTGVFQVAHAVRVRKSIDHEWMLILSGILSVLVGVFMLLYPASGALAIVWLLAAWSIVSGVMLVSLALRLRKRRATSA
ncbi:MAG TPA: HdeD family acid-resistance protein [Casimicrobiaceae bacterium]|nr:HdeD family acid-resistance protein [Casimicrobiaceae bacterium]